METTEILRQLAVIVVAAKFFGLVARRIHAPQVAGEIVAGLIIGPSLLGFVMPSDFLSGMAEIGVIMLMFSAGLGTDLRELRETGVKATVIACAGVFVPLVCGTILYMCFYGFAPVGSEAFYKALFIGTILTATSVSITVEALKELGVLSGTIGTTIMSAAIIDDVIGIIVLTIVISFKDPNADIVSVILHTVLFFVFAVGVGIITYHIFKIIDKRYPHTRRIPIMGMALAFIMAYVADSYFSVADITGAYIAGVILSSLDDSSYISRKMDVNSYMLFGPVFFCSIGLQTNVRTLDTTIIYFSIGFVLVGLLSKIIGCGGISKIMRYSWGDSAKIGVGMMTRGEVALIVAQRGLAAGMMGQAYFTAVILLIIVSSILTPVVLKFLFDVFPEAHVISE
ncbi:MAG: cation:proton antiporter [Lachnospiraceae bacterium]|nr:cation:proton antiporter [Lachnospiraceae bacterium]MBQ9606867.1 cation:proton antiporter [Lachnospiraceae bacterium]MBR1524344.1 cation:proton antiporter [Lachnospiraceae bacterium]